MRVLVEQITIPGSTQAAHYFGRTLKSRLNDLANHPQKICKKPEPNSILCSFRQYVRLRRGRPSEIKLLLFKCPRKAGGEHHHWIVVDGGYYVDFFEKALAELNGDHRKLSNVFLHKFCGFTTLEQLEWVESFHVHFLRSDKIGPNMSFWKEHIIARHHESDLNFIRKANAGLWQIEFVDNGGQSEVEYQRVKPEMLFVEHRLTIN